MLKRLIAAVVTLAVSCAASPALAQFTYKSTMPDGRVIYGDAPVPGAKKVEKTKHDTSDKGVRPPVAREAQVLKQLEAARAARDRPDRKQQAEEALRKAEAALAAGKEPLPGERIGTAGGGSRLTEAYFARQKRLEATVEAARRELEAANSGVPGDPQAAGGSVPGFAGFPPPSGSGTQGTGAAPPGFGSSSQSSGATTQSPYVAPPPLGSSPPKSGTAPPSGQSPVQGGGQAGFGTAPTGKR